jgi:hypothetical protein
MLEPTSQTTSVILAGAGAGAASSVLGLDGWAFFWAFLGVVCWQAVQPPMAEKRDIKQAAGWAVVAMVLGTFGSMICLSVLLNFPRFKPYLVSVEPAVLIALPAFVFGFAGQALGLLGLRLIKTYKRGES